MSKQQKKLEPQAEQESKVQIEVPNTLAGALLIAQSSIDGVGKDARNSFHKYAYTSAEGMISACREALHGAGLTLQRSGWTLAQDGMTVTSTFILRHAASGQQEAYEVPWLVVVEKGRPIDKALAGALTTSLGYLLRDLLLLPREDEDGSMDRRNDDPKTAQHAVGFRPAPAPAPRTDPVKELNAKLAEPPLPAQRCKGELEKITQKLHEGVEFDLGVVKADGGEKVAFVIGRNRRADAFELLGKRVEVEWQPRTGKSSVLLSIKALEDREEVASDEALPF